MIATLLRSRSRRMRSPRLVKWDMGDLCLGCGAARRASAHEAMPGQTAQVRAAAVVLRRPQDTHQSRFRRRGVIRAAAAGEQLSLRVEHARLRGRELAPHAHDLAAYGEIPR